MNFNLDLVILKVLISNKKYALEFVNEYDAKLFSPEVWNFANVIINYIKNYKELPTLRIISERLNKGNNSKLLENINKIWEQINSVVYDDKEYLHDLEKLKKRFAEKQIITIKEKLGSLDPGNIDVNRVVNDIQKSIHSVNSISQTKSYERKTLKEALPSFTERFNAKKNNPDLETGIKTGYSFLDYSCNGLKPADFLIIAGESGFGKSLFLNNLSLQIWLQQNSIFNGNNFTEGKNVVFFSLEMPYDDCFNRIIGRLSGVPIRKIENAALNKEEFHKVKQALDFIKNYPYNFEIIDISDVCANDCNAILDDIHYQVDVVAVDYLGIMNTNERSDDDDWLKQGQCAYELRAIGRKRQIPILSAAQLNRKNPNKSSEENIGLNRLARSGTIATHATTILQIESRDKEELFNDINIHIIKQRKGPKLKGRLLKDLSCATLLDIPGEYSEMDNYFTDMDDISEQIEDLELS